MKAYSGNKKIKPLNILIISFDWRNIFENDYKELIMKLERDRLGPKINKIFLFNWSIKTYYKEKGNIVTYHKKARFKHFRVIYDLLAVFLAPYILYKKKFRPDVVWVRDFPFAFGGLIPKLLWKSKIALFLGTIPSDLIRTRQAPHPRLIYQKITEWLGKKLIDNYFANGQATKEYLTKSGIQPDRVKIITENIIDRDREYINRTRSGKIRERYKVPENKKILLSAGRLEPEKNFSKLLEVFSALKREDLILIIAGDGILSRELKNKAKELKIENKVIFTGWVNRGEIWNLYADADIFILLSKSEGNPTVFREAMYMRVPVIGSRIPGIEEFIGKDGERGYYWEESEGIKKLKEKTNNLLSSSKVMSIVKRAKDYIEINISRINNINDVL